MALIAGLPAGTEGKISRMTGLTARATWVISPASSATFIKPRKNAMTPMRPMARSTAPRAELRMAAVSASICPDAAAIRMETRVTTTKRPLSMSDGPSGQPTVRAGSPAGGDAGPVSAA